MADSNWIRDFLEAAADFAGVRLDYMPLYIHAFLADDNVQVMNTEQVGAYVLLLMRGWLQEPPASLPDDDVKLAKWAGLTKGRWDRMRATVLAPFHVGPDGRLYQKRLAREWLNSARNYAGKKRGAEVTNAKRKAMAERDAERRGVRTHVLPDPTQPVLPQLPDPTQPGSGTHSVGSASGANGAGSASGSGSGGNLGVSFNQGLRRSQPPDDADFERAGKVQQLLNGLKVNAETTRQLMLRRDITPQLIERELADIHSDPKVLDATRCLVSRLQGKQK